MPILPIALLFKKPLPFVTILSLAWCTIVFACINLSPNLDWPQAQKLGYFSGDAIANGASLPLFTHAFVHIEFLHYLFNMYWLFLLGPVLERKFGSLMAAFFLFTAAIASSGVQLASGDVGIGFSGVGYAMVGFGWVARTYQPDLRQAFDDKTIKLFGGWFLVCIVTTIFNIMPVANWAHAAGAAFGALFAYAVFKPSSLAKAATAGVIALAFVPVYWNPLSYDWNVTQAYRLGSKAKYAESLPYLLRAQGKTYDPSQDIYVWECLATTYAGLKNSAGYKRAIDALELRDSRKAKEYTDSYGYPLGVFKEVQP